MTTATDAAPAAPGTTARAWEVVLQSIEADLLNGRLRPGDHLPPERTLAADLGVGRSSVREAVRVLEVLGLIRTATGSGPSAGAIIVATPSGGMSALMRLQVAAQGFDVADVVATRLLLETAVVTELATAGPSARSGTGGTGTAGAETGPSTSSGTDGAGTAGTGTGAAAQLLDAMDSPALTAAEFLALDAQFHVCLAEASGNLVVAATMAGLRSAIEGYVLAAVPNLPSWSATVARLRNEHRGILNAIDAGDTADASARVRAHITGYYAESRLTPSRHAGDSPRAVPRAADNPTEASDSPES